ncbi:ABC transporter permease [Spirochaetia bacterium]|nr:ABC transporter permease [Spirochaetia bacterium]
MKSYKLTKGINRTFIYLFLLLAGACCIFPFLWMVSTSFKSMGDAFSVPPTLIPKKFIFENYPKGWGYADFNRYSINTVFIALTATIGVIITASLVAYGFSRFKSRLSGILFTVLLGTMMLPSQVTLIPQYLLYNKLNLIDTYWPLLLPSWVGGGAFNIFLFVQFFKTMPKELDEAATVDGANSFQIFIYIMLPSVKPVILAVGVMSLVYNWNDFFTPLIYLNSMPKYTIAIGLQFFQSVYGTMRIGMMMAVATLAVLPVLVIFFVCQKYFVEGIKMSGLKA